MADSLRSVWIRSYLRLTIGPRAGSERGANLVEYALLLALIVVVCIGGVRALGAEVPGSFSSASTAL